MGYTDVIIKALGLQHVIIEKIDERASELKLIVHVRQDVAHCRCHACKNSFIGVHEWKEREISAPPLGAFIFVKIILFQLKGVCHICGDHVRSAEVPFVHPQFGNMTLSLCEYAGKLMEEITCEAAARFLGLNSKTLWNLDQFRMRFGLRP